jgi:glutathione S-transferase
MSITLYYTPMGSATRAHWALLELGIPYEKVRVRFDQGDNKKAEFLAVNPNGKVPAMVDGDLKLFESLAIIFHLGDRYGVDKGLWPKSGTDARSEAYVWSIWSMVEVQTTAFEYIKHGGEHPRLSLPKDKQHKDAADRALATWKHCIKMLDDRLASRSWILGDAFSLCDCAVGSVVSAVSMMGQLPVEGQHVSDWRSRCMSRPALAKAMADA